MDPVTTAALISGGAQLIGSGTNAAIQGRMNRKTREFSEKMYGVQRQDALTDWNAQNQYNHPAQQMQRLREAGLNPHLVYGKGADNTAAMVRSSSNQSYSPIAPRMDTNIVGDTFNRYYQLKKQQADTDQVQALTKVAQQETLLKAAQTANTIQGTATNKFQLESSQKLLDGIISKQALENQTLSQNLSLNLQRNEREQLANSSNVALTMQKILTEQAARKKYDPEIQLLRQNLENHKTQNELNKLDLQWRNMGITPHDPFYFRLMGDFIKGGSDQPRTAPNFGINQKNYEQIEAKRLIENWSKNRKK